MRRRFLSLIPVLTGCLLASAGPLLTGCEEGPTGSGCCRVCREGKACGDACIPEGSTCRSPAGCACGG